MDEITVKIGQQFHLIDCPIKIPPGFFSEDTKEVLQLVSNSKFPMDQVNGFESSWDNKLVPDNPDWYPVAELILCKYHIDQFSLQPSSSQQSDLLQRLQRDVKWRSYYNMIKYLLVSGCERSLLFRWCVHIANHLSNGEDGPSEKILNNRDSYVSRRPVGSGDSEMREIPELQPMDPFEPFSMASMRLGFNFNPDLWDKVEHPVLLNTLDLTDTCKIRIYLPALCLALVRVHMGAKEASFYQRLNQVSSIVEDIYGIQGIKKFSFPENHYLASWTRHMGLRSPEIMDLMGKALLAYNEDFHGKLGQACFRLVVQDWLYPGLAHFAAAKCIHQQLGVDYEKIFDLCRDPVNTPRALKVLLEIDQQKEKIEDRIWTAARLFNRRFLKHVTDRWTPVDSVRLAYIHRLISSGDRDPYQSLLHSRDDNMFQELSQQDKDDLFHWVIQFVPERRGEIYAKHLWS